MKKIVIQYGVLSGLGLLAMFGLIELLGVKDYKISEILGYVAILVSMVFVFLGIREYREKVGEGQVTFWQAVKVGVLIVVIPSIVFGLLNVIYVAFIDPEFMEKFYAASLADMKATLSAEEFAIKSAEMESQKEMFMSPFAQFFVMGATVFLIGIVASVLSSFALKKE